MREVEKGAVAGYRVDAAPEGKVLVRVKSMGEGYRVANFEEEIYTLDEAGEARRAMSATVTEVLKRARFGEGVSLRRLNAGTSACSMRLAAILDAMPAVTTATLTMVASIRF